MTVTYERGWSSRIDRKVQRFLTRMNKSRMITLPPGQAVATITFDDVPDSAAGVGAATLVRHGVRGTFYVAAATCDHQDTHWRVASPAQIRALNDSGHEIGCHTATHVNVQSLGAAALVAECAENQARLDEICGGVQLTNFAYPFGDLGLRQQIVLERRFASCRTIYEFVNTGRIRLSRLGAIGLFDSRLDRAALGALIARVRAEGGWLVFYTHDVAAAPSFMGTSPGLLADTLTMLADAGMPVLTMREALKAFAAPVV